MQRRLCLSAGAAAAFGLSLSARTAWGQTFPNKPLRIIVPNAAGGAADLTARAVGQKLGEALGQPVLIDNRPGAGGVVAGELVAKADPDGHTLLLISSGTAVSAALFKTLPFDTLKDFAPVSTMAFFDLGLVVAESDRFKTVAELLAWARAHPGQLNIGTPNIGTTQHLAAELLLISAGIEAQVVPFNGSGPVVTALRSGAIDAAVDILGPLLPQIQSHGLRPLAVLGSKRVQQLPEVPALRESGGPLAAFNVSSWNGLAVPARTPREVVLRLNQELQKVLAQPDIRRRLLELNLVAASSSPEQQAEILASDIRRWAEVIARAKIAKL